MTTPRLPPGHASRYFDRIAIALSAICIVHCLAVPLAVAVLPVAALAVGGDAHFHQLMLWLVVPTSVAGFALGYRVHRRVGVVAVAAAAVLALAAAATWGHASWGFAAEAAVSVAASLALAGAHWVNFREVRRLHHHPR
ncbi:MAG TPA: MerC domain-containing protein [Gammaproteobacteria bacterium]